MADTQIRIAGPTSSDESMVTTDQNTILGNGTSSDPLRAGPSGGGGTFQAAFRGDPGDAFPGLPVFIAFFKVDPDPGGITTVQQTDVRSAPPQFASFAQVAGVITAVNGDGTVQVQASGTITLTVDQWDAATGGSGALVLGHVYYPAIFPASGLTDIRPDTAGQWATRVGVALNETTLLLDIAAPAQILGDSISFSTNAGPQPPVGTVVFSDGSADRVSPATSAGTIPEATALGVITAYQGTTPIVQSTGRATLTTAQWDAVTGGSGGLIPGDPYYVGTGGHLTVTRPTTPGQNIALVGVAVSSTTMVLTCPPMPITVA